jgi:phosphoribosyl-ATP pyrophosphohydrolase
VGTLTKAEKLELIKSSIQLSGKEFHLVMLGEECGELLTAASQCWRGRVNNDAVATEMADVLIMIDCIKEVFGITDNEVNKKLKSQYDRFNGKVYDAIWEAKLADDANWVD